MNNQHYEYVLKELISQRDELNRAIETVQKIKESGALGSKGLQHSNVLYPSNSTDYRGMTLLPAIKKLLISVNKPLKALEMAEKLQAGGFIFGSETPQNTIASILSRAYGEKDPDIDKIDRGLWACKK